MSGAFVAGALVVAGCGGGGDDPIVFDSPPSDTASTSAGTATTVAATPTSSTVLSVASTQPAPPATTVDPGLQIAGTAWVEATDNLTGLSSECGNMHLVAGHPDRDMVIAGIAGRGLYASTDGSPSWSPLGEGPGSATITNRATAIVYDPERPDTFWESGIYNGPGVYRTDDGGATFRQLGDLTHVDLVAVDLADPERQTLLAGLHEQSSVWRSSDGGETWTDLSASLPAGIGQTASMMVVDAQTYLVGSKSGPASGIFRTTDAGSTWTQVHAGGVHGAPLVAPATGSVLWLDALGGGLVISDDGGVTWQAVAAPLLANPPTNLVEVSEGRVATLGNENIVVSGDQGRTWRAVGPPLPYRPNGVAFSPARQAIYVWRFDCNVGENPVPSDAIMRLDVAPTGG